LAGAIKTVWSPIKIDTPTMVTAVTVEAVVAEIGATKKMPKNTLSSKYHVRSEF